MHVMYCTLQVRRLQQSVLNFFGFDHYPDRHTSHSISILIQLSLMSIVGEWPHTRPHPCGLDSAQHVRCSTALSHNAHVDFGIPPKVMSFNYFQHNKTSDQINKLLIQAAESTS